ncbi:MAG: hypothetical protein ACYTGL_17660 [Planctomycetota bacterium]|jgi:hypothetical protein
MSQWTESGETISPADLDAAFTKVLGYLNFSGGKADAAFLAALDLVARDAGFEESWAPLRLALLDRLTALQNDNAAFSDCSQAQTVIDLVFDTLLPGYFEYHRDLLFHLQPDDLHNPFFLGRCFEAALEQAGPWDETDRIVGGAIERLNDYLGYRPIAVLEDGRKMTPYSHERFRPLPLYVSGAGVCSGPHRRIVERALELMASVPGEVVNGAHFDLERLDELALDVRAYDHDHPAFKRTNYLFGEWDPHLIDNSGYYRRFIVRKIILDALVDWVAGQKDQVEAVFDAGSVLCGTMLMASSISGDGPATHDSTVSLTSLLPVVARQRDDFYLRLMQTADGPRARRLLKHAQQTQQPFGHVRQALNLHLAHYGARQVQYRTVSAVYARMGHAAAAREQAAVIPSTSARFESEILCRIASAKIDLERGQLESADELLREVEDLLTRGIDCGALVDPWNILGFQGNYPLFAAREDSIPDQRVEILLDIVERLFGVFSRALSEAAAQGQTERLQDLSERFEELTTWWDQFASHVIEDLPKVIGGEDFESASHVARALAEWRAAGEGAGDISFWRRHVDVFTSAKSFACVVESLLARNDHVAAMALLVQWLCSAEDVGIESGPYSIHALLIEWMKRVTSDGDDGDTPRCDWPAVRRLFDFLEANAGSYWDVPQLDAVAAGIASRNDDADLDAWDVERGDDWLNAEDEDDDESKLFQAAYDDITFKDSTDDGVEAEMLEGGTAPGNTEFEILNRELEPRIKFIMALAQLWQIASTAMSAELAAKSDGDDGEVALTDEQIDALLGWLRRVRSLQNDLLLLMNSVWEREVDESVGDHDANVEYDIQIQTKFYLLNTIIATHINCRVAEVGLLCLLPLNAARESLGKEEQEMVEFYRAVIGQDVGSVRKQLQVQFRRLARKPLLYVPLDGGGHPMQILAARTVQTDIRFLLTHLPRMGLFRETWHVSRLAHRMERETRLDGMAVTEFDRIFRTALRNSIECLMDCAAAWDGDSFSDENLLSLITDILEHYRSQWHRHSRTMRLSSVEGLQRDVVWDDVCDFIEKYGEDLFHARNLTLGNVRTILHNGVDWFLAQLAEYEDPLHPVALLRDLEDGIVDIDDASEMLELIYGSVVDKFDRFLEYNTTTTQSDYGSKFHVLLDFLRVEAEYDRDAWDRIPEGIVHRVLAMADRPGLLRMLEEQIEQESRQQADRHVAALHLLEQKYGVHLPGINDRLNERFVKPLAVNRMLALIEPALRTATSGDECEERFEQLRAEITSYMHDQAGSAIDIPQWLQDVEREVNRLEMPADYIRPPELDAHMPVVRVAEADIRQQLAVWSQSLTISENPRRRRGSRKQSDD